MINDRETNIVYLSEWLSNEKCGHPDFYNRLTNLLDRLGIKWGVLRHTND